MQRALLSAPVAAILLAACGGGPPPPPPEPETVVRVDTVVVTREVEPPLPEGRVATLCLASGQTAEIRISPAGDTLVGPRRVRIADLGPGVGFVGNYAADEAWFVHDETVTFERRRFSKFGQPESRGCGTMKIVGDVHGVNLFTEMSAASPFSTVYVPVRPGVFQPYQANVGQVRG